VSNEKYSETKSNILTGLALPRHAGNEDKDRTADLPIFTKVQIVPETADIPVPEEFRIKWLSAWPEALSAVMTIGLMVIIALTVGCRTGDANMTATMTSTPTLAAPSGIAFDNLGDLAAISSATPFRAAGFQKAQQAPTAGPASNPFLAGTATTLNAPAGCNFCPVVK
jgi:hypothetical protein